MERIHVPATVARKFYKFVDSFPSSQRISLEGILFSFAVPKRAPFRCKNALEVDYEWPGCQPEDTDDSDEDDELDEDDESDDE